VSVRWLLAFVAAIASLTLLWPAASSQSLRGNLSTIEMVLTASRVQDLQRQLSGLTGGEGVLESTFVGYQPVIGDQPTRRRTSIV